MPRSEARSSPDRAEALVLACVRVIPREQTVSCSGNYSINIAPLTAQAIRNIARMIFVNNRLEGNAPGTIESVVLGPVE